MSWLIMCNVIIFSKVERESEINEKMCMSGNIIWKWHFMSKSKKLLDLRCFVNKKQPRIRISVYFCNYTDMMQIIEIWYPCISNQCACTGWGMGRRSRQTANTAGLRPWSLSASQCRTLPSPTHTQALGVDIHAWVGRAHRLVCRPTYCTRWLENTYQWRLANTGHWNVITVFRRE